PGHTRRADGERIFITGVGAWTGYGAGWERLRSALGRGESALAMAGAELPGAEELTVALVRDLAPFRAAFPKARSPLPVRQTRLLLVAAAEALADAGAAAEGRRPGPG